MDELRQAEEAQADPLRVWRLTLEVLNLMHSMDDQAHKRLGPDYREVTRRASEDGRTQAALTLVRGIAHHHGSEVQALVWRGMEVLAFEKGRLVPMKVNFVEAESCVERSRSPSRRPGGPDRSCRPRQRSTCTTGTPITPGTSRGGLMEPLLAAQRFMVGLTPAVGNRR